MQWKGSGKAVARQWQGSGKAPNGAIVDANIPNTTACPCTRVRPKPSYPGMTARSCTRARVRMMGKLCDARSSRSSLQPLSFYLSPISFLLYLSNLEEGRGGTAAAAASAASEPLQPSAGSNGTIVSCVCGQSQSDPRSDCSTQWASSSDSATWTDPSMLSALCIPPLTVGGVLGRNRGAAAAD